MPQRYGTPSYLTSQIYPVQVIEAMTGASVPQPSVFYQGFDQMIQSSSFLSGTLASSLHTYTNWPPENIIQASDFLSGTITLALIQYTNWPAEKLIQGSDFISGTLT